MYRDLKSVPRAVGSSFAAPFSARTAMSNDLDLEKVLESAPDAVPLNQTALQIIKRAGDPSTTASDIAAILREDQALSARVLKIANSAFYGLPRQIGSIKSAVLLLGQKNNPQSGVDGHHVWRHREADFGIRPAPGRTFSGTRWSWRAPRAK